MYEGGGEGLITTPAVRECIEGLLKDPALLSDLMTSLHAGGVVVDDLLKATLAVEDREEGVRRVDFCPVLDSTSGRVKRGAEVKLGLLHAKIKKIVDCLPSPSSNPPASDILVLLPSALRSTLPMDLLWVTLLSALALQGGVDLAPPLAIPLVGQGYKTGESEDTLMQRRVSAKKDAYSSHSASLLCLPSPVVLLSPLPLPPKGSPSICMQDRIWSTSYARRVNIPTPSLFLAPPLMTWDLGRLTSHVK